MPHTREVVITGMGTVSPLGTGLEAFRAGVAAGRSPVGPLSLLDTTFLPVKFGAELHDFDAKQYVKPRKSLKVMSRDIQTAFAAADMALAHANLVPASLPPERVGVVFGADMIYTEVDELADAFRKCIVDGRYNHDRWGEAALSSIYPLWMLKYLPNYPACHVGIAHDLRGPNNSIVMGEASSLLAMSEAASYIERGIADVMLTGGTGTRLTVACMVYHGDKDLSHRVEDPEHASRPFDEQRDGMVYGEGSAVLIFEERQHAEARGAKIYGRVLGWSSTYEDRRRQSPGDGSGFRRAIKMALESSKLSAADIGHVNAHGESTIHGDIHEARSIRETLGDVPVLAMKSYFGNIGAGSGAVELLPSLHAFETGEIPPTINYQSPDPHCPVNVIHGSPHSVGKPVVLKVNQSRTGQTAAIVIAGA